jgi:uncharacterized protein (TIGR03435 family)
MKTKIAIPAAVILLLLLVIAVKLIFFGSIKDDYFALNSRSLQQTPSGLIVLRPTHYPFLRHADPLLVRDPNSRSNVWMVGRNAGLPEVIGIAYGENSSHVILPADAPKTNFDFLVTANRDSRERLQTAIRERLGYRAQTEMREVEILALKVVNPNLPGMKLSDASEKRSAGTDAMKIKFTRLHASAVAALLNQFYNLSVVDKTGLTDDYDYSLPISAVMQHSTGDKAAIRATANALIKDLGLGLAPEMEPREVLVVKKIAAATPIVAEKNQLVIGPLNPGAEDGCKHWYHGIVGSALLLTDGTDPGTGDNDFTLENSSTNRYDHADWRSEHFSLGAATNGTRPLKFSFDYKLPGPVKDADNLRVQLRFYDHATNFINEKNFWVGSKTHDSAMTKYETFVADDIVTPAGAQVSDVVLSANFYPEDLWSSGPARFDNILVTISK